MDVRLEHNFATVLGGTQKDGSVWGVAWHAQVMSLEHIVLHLTIQY
jgi:hypothetical protein